MPITARDLRRFKAEGRRFAMLTSYDVLLARAFEVAGIPLILVGDSLGVFVLGQETTLAVTMENVIHHCRAVRAGLVEALLVADLPFGAYQASLEEGVRNGIRLLKEGGAAVVKLEGPEFALVDKLTAKGVPVMAHLGLTPQSFHQLGGNRVQARSEDAVTGLVANARRLEEAGACALVLEGIPNEAARRVTDVLEIPTIGIGAGPHCDGQVLVGPEMLGMSNGAAPRFAKRYAELFGTIVAAATQFAADVEQARYPDKEHSYDWPIR